MDGGERTDAPGATLRAFWLHLVDNLFRHKVLFAIPVAVFTLFGVNQAVTNAPMYEATAIMRTIDDPYAGMQVVRRADLQSRTTPAEGSVRLIEEQLRTAGFATDVATRAGLGDAIGAGWGVLAVIRDRVDFRPVGASLIEVSAAWEDPETSRALVEAAIATYTEYIATTTSADAFEAESFYLAVLASADDDLAVRERELGDFLTSASDAPSAEELNISQQTNLSLLESRVDRARAAVSSAREQVQVSAIAREVAEDDDRRIVTLIDAPNTPSNPASTTERDIATVLAHLVMGIVVAFSALLVTTTVDQALTVPSELATVSAVDSIVIVPPILERRAPRFRRRRSDRTSLAGAEVS